MAYVPLRQILFWKTSFENPHLEWHLQLLHPLQTRYDEKSFYQSMDGLWVHAYKRHPHLSYIGAGPLEKKYQFTSPCGHFFVSLQCSLSLKFVASLCSWFCGFVVVFQLIVIVLLSLKSFCASLQSFVVVLHIFLSCWILIVVLHLCSYSVSLYSCFKCISFKSSESCFTSL